MKTEFRTTQIALAVASVLSAAAMSAAYAGEPVATPKTPGTYVTGDFHNHTTCSDGSISMQKLVKKSMDTNDTPWGLDWFVQAGHGGNGNRNCTLAEDATLATPAYPLVFTGDGTTLQGPQTSWQNTNPSIQPKGLVSGNAPNQRMWRWQSLQEYQYPITEYLAALKGQPLFLGLESVVAGHEHTSMAVITGQFPAGVYSQTLPTSAGYSPLGNATALSEWSYCFDRGDSDTSRGNTTVGGSEGNSWNCSVAGSANEADPSWNAVAQKLMPAGGAGTGERGHYKTVEAMKWMQQKHPDGSFYVPAHLERAGPFNPNGNNGFNIEHLRNFNNAAPSVAFGMETQPGHGASDTRGEYNPNRNNFGTGIGNVDSAGGTTWGGTGIYGSQIGGVWDALLGEGRNWWFFASSDWHNRGSFGPDDRRTTQDFYPGEYQRDYVKVGANKTNSSGVLTPSEIVDGLRSGNSWAASGQLIDRLAFVVCEDTKGGMARFEKAALQAAKANDDVSIEANCASMGEKLEVKPGADLIVAIAVRDPSGRNYAPYTFPNPSLLQIGMNEPLNKPVLQRIDVIGGAVTGYKQPGAADYSGQWPDNWIDNPDMSTVPDGAKNPTAALKRTFSWHSWKVAHSDYRTMVYRIRDVANSQYLRLRGTNLPASVPFETDADGNPLADVWTNQTGINPSVPGGADGIPANANLRIPCTTVGTNIPENGVTFTGTTIDGCPAHLPEVNGQKYSAYDVAAWADLWFYSNPVFIEVQGSALVAGVK
ncbi:MAG TPA: hypothetical protein VFS58_09980 [Steroidobacteraceae bacterium]|nr:hypothetical protein [Steroidobacteraceae bacterium]